MKRIYIAFALLLTVAVLSGGALWLQNSVTEKLLTACEHVITVYESGDMAACREAANELSDHLEDDMRWFPFFLQHARMESIFQQAAALPHLIDDNDPADFLSAVAAIKMQLEILMDNEWPTAPNIL